MVSSTTGIQPGIRLTPDAFKKVATKELFCPVCKKHTDTVRADSLTASRLCDSPKCHRISIWRTASIENQIKSAESVGIGRNFIRDGKLPILTDFSFGKHFKDMSRGVYCYGPVGTGKTLALCCVACEYLAEGKTVLMRSWERIKWQINSSYSDSSNGNAEQILKQYIRPEVLLIDDLCSGKESEASTTLLWVLTDARYAAGKLTCFSSNHPLKAIPDMYTIPIARRIEELCREVKMTKVIGRQKL